MPDIESFEAVGVDGCKAGWLVAGWTGTELSLVLVPKLKDLLPRLSFGARILIDIPIGLSEDGYRSCDVAARKRLGKRSSSLFSAPPRFALGYDCYSSLNHRCKLQTGRGISKQSFFLLPKIREVDQLVHSGQSKSVFWYETHPELCFISMNKGNSLRDSKKTETGYLERIQILGGWIEHEIQGMTEKFLHSTRRSEVARDDVLDALVCLVVAKMSDSLISFLPDRLNERDQTGLIMRICYPKLIKT